MAGSVCGRKLRNALLWEAGPGGQEGRAGRARELLLDPHGGPVTVAGCGRGQGAPATGLG